MTDLTITPGCTVLIAGFDDIPSHQFLVDEVFEDCITGTALTGPLAGEYGEPDIALVLQVLVETNLSRAGVREGLSPCPSLALLTKSQPITQTRAIAPERRRHVTSD